MSTTSTAKRVGGKEEIVPLAKIRTDDSTQTRAAVRPDVVEEYREVLEGTEGGEAWPFPPVVVFREKRGEPAWIGDGFHRCLAAEAAGWACVLAEVHQGGRLDALRFALGANAHHGLRRTREDIRRSVSRPRRRAGRSPPSGDARRSAAPSPSAPSRSRSRR